MKISFEKKSPNNFSKVSNLNLYMFLNISIWLHIKNITVYKESHEYFTHIFGLYLRRKIEETKEQKQAKKNPKVILA